MTFVGALRQRALEPHLQALRAIYENPPADIHAFQLQRFNVGWGESLRRSPIARAQRDRLKLPETFESWAQVEAIVPVQTKSDLRPDLAAGDPPEQVRTRSTGGTTAEPLRFPVFGSEADSAGHDLWLCRERLGVTPADRLFMIWGHALMFGTGPKARLIKIQRRLTDMAAGYTRWSAYRMAPGELEEAGEALLRSRADYIIGYSCALDRLARANLHRADAFRTLKLKAVIATAEGFPHADSREVIAACFGAPAVMEYGAVETGPIAYERPGGGFDTLWATHRLELGEPAGSGNALILTSLNARAMPLIRYAVGDAVEADETAGLMRFSSVAGRINDAVTLADGTPIHSEAFTHVLRDLKGIRAYQIVRKSSGGVPTIRYEADAPLDEATVARLAERLGKIDPSLSATPLDRVDALPLSTAGKHRMIVEEA